MWLSVPSASTVLFLCQAGAVGVFASAIDVSEPYGHMFEVCLEVDRSVMLHLRGGGGGGGVFSSLAGSALV